MLFEFPREVSGVFVTEKRCRLLDGAAIPQQFNRAALSLFTKPDLRIFAHFLEKIPLQRP